MKISVLPHPPTASPKPDPCLVFMLPQKEKAPLPASLRRLTDQLFKDKIFTGKAREVLFLPFASVEKSRHLVLVGLGDNKTITEETLRQGAARAYRCLESHSQSHATFETKNLKPFVPDPGKRGQVIGEGVLLARYQFNDLKKKNPSLSPVRQIHLRAGKEDLTQTTKGLREGGFLAEGTNFARWLADHPANLMTPTLLADHVQKKLTGLDNVKVSVWNKARIQKENMGGLLGVSLGSNQEPRMIQVEYRGGSKGERPICLVGKGLTFDSGGISLKPPLNMDEMKFDMCGGTAVLGAMLALARLKPKVNVTGLVGATENMPGAGANKPGDILRARNGKTMEVLNTDAEGRLVLADILSYAGEMKPVFMVDAATLTGAVVVALSNTYTGLFTRNKEMKQKLMRAADTAGEKMWPLPLDDFHVKDIKGTVGDVANISSTRGAGSSTAAAFLEQFAPKGIPWAHLDIAGTAYNVDKRLPYCRAKSASGVMVRTFVELCRQSVP